MLQPLDRRSATRYRSESFATPFGEVIDVSSSGIRVSHRGRRVARGDLLRLSISWTGDLVELDCEVRHAKPAGFRRQVLGLRWVQPPPGLEAWLKGGGGRATECVGPRVYRHPDAA